MHRKFKYIILIFIICLILDFLIGKLSDISEIRNDAYLFRNQAEKLVINTRYLKKNISDKYQLTPNTFETSETGLLKNLSNEDKNIKILFIGGSTTENNEVKDSKRFHNLLNKAFIDNDLTFYNGGVRGNTTLDSINLLINHTSYKRGYDYYILMHNINDRNFLNEFPDYKFQVKARNFTRLNLDTFYYKILDKLTYNSNIIFFIRYKFFYFFPWADKVDQIYKDQNKIKKKRIDSSLAYRQNLNAFISIIKSRNATPILMTQPLGFENKQQIEFNNIIRNVAKIKKVTLIDLEKEIDGKNYFLGDGVHFNDNGSEFAAEIIKKSIEKNILTKKKTDLNIFDSIKEVCEEQSNKGVVFDLGLSGRYPVMSPKLSKFAIQIFENGKSGVLILDSKKKLVKKKINKNFHIRHPFFINENQIILSMGDLKKENIFLYDLNTEKFENILKDKNLYSSSIPYYTNNKIIFSGTRIKENRISQPDIYIYDLISGNLKQITHNSYEDWRPVYDSVEGHIYFISYKNKNFDLMKYDESSQKIKMINFSKMDEWDPSIDVLNQKLFFSSKLEGNWNIYVKNLKNNLTDQVTFGVSDKWDPFVRPDLKTLFYADYNNEETRIKYLCY